MATRAGDGNFLEPAAQPAAQTAPRRPICLPHAPRSLIGDKCERRDLDSLSRRIDDRAAAKDLTALRDELTGSLSRQEFSANKHTEDLAPQLRPQGLARAAHRPEGPAWRARAILGPISRPLHCRSAHWCAGASARQPPSSLLPLAARRSAIAHRSAIARRPARLSSLRVAHCLSRQQPRPPRRSHIPPCLLFARADGQGPRRGGEAGKAARGHRF